MKYDISEFFQPLGFYYIYCITELSRSSFNKGLNGRELVYCSTLDFKKDAPDIPTLNMIITPDLK